MDTLSSCKGPIKSFLISVKVYSVHCEEKEVEERRKMLYLELPQALHGSLNYDVIYGCPFHAHACHAFEHYVEFATFLC